MKKYLAFFALGMMFFLSGCGQKNSGGDSTKNDNGGGGKSAGIENICSYFPKELVESAIGKPIVKVEVPIMGSEYCNYYTAYSEKYNHTPYGDNPGGPHIVVVYDTKDFAKDKISNEKSGTKYETDSSIGMDNFVMRNNAKKIWQTALVLGGDKYIRIKFIDDAVTGDDLVKIAKKFAEKIKAGK
jgi:hypothetical protein